jgi:hypothetical protein
MSVCTPCLPARSARRNIRWAHLHAVVPQEAAVATQNFSIGSDTSKAKHGSSAAHGDCCANQQTDSFLLTPRLNTPHRFQPAVRLAEVNESSLASPQSVAPIDCNRRAFGGFGCHASVGTVPESSMESEWDRSRPSVLRMRWRMPAPLSNKQLTGYP